MRFFSTHKTAKRIAAIGFFCALLAPVAPDFSVQRAEGFFGLFGGDAAATAALVTKEYSLDAIAHTLAKQMLSDMTTSITNWINSGFEGSPAFITDLNGYLLNAADQVAGQFISQNLGALCSPFELDIQIALNIQYQEARNPAMKAQCTFTGVIDNIKNLGSSMTNWHEWFQITTQPQNNPYGAYTIASAALSAEVNGVVAEESALLNFGDGFLSQRQCQDVEGGGQTCQIVTPGRVISDQLNKSLGAGQDALIAADEIDEVINALVAQLAQQAVTGVNGLLGLSGGSFSGSGASGSGGPSYLDQINSSNGGGANPIAAPLAIEQDALAILEAITAAITAIENDIPGDCSLNLASELRGYRTTAENVLPERRAIVGTLSTLNSNYLTAGTAAAQNNIYRDYLELAANADLYTEEFLENLRTEQDIINDEIDDFEDEINDECD